MASVKVKFRPSTIEGKEGTIYYQIIQNRVIRQLKTDYRIFTEEWNEAGSCIIVSNSERSNLLLSLQERMEWVLRVPSASSGATVGISRLWQQTIISL